MNDINITTAYTDRGYYYSNMHVYLLIDVEVPLGKHRIQFDLWMFIGVNE